MYQPGYAPAWTPEPVYHGMGSMMQVPHSVHGEWCQLRVVPDPAQSPISCISFDSEEELVFVGHHSGRIVSYESPSLEKYSAFLAHDAPILDIVGVSSSILSLSHTGLRCHKKGGLQQFDFSSDSFCNDHLLCMCPSSSVVGGAPNSVLIGGEMPSMFIFDLEKQSIINEVSMSQGVSIIRPGRLTACGGLRGQVSLRDPRTFRVEHTVEAFQGAISGLDVKESLMAVCGYAGHQYYLDQAIKVYDVRTMRPLPTVGFRSGAFQLKFFPMFTSMLVAFSQTGEVLIGDVQTPAGMEYYQVELFGDSLLSMDLSSSGEGLCFGDGGGHLHLWAGSEKPQVNRFSKMTAWPKVPSLHRPPRLLDDDEPLSCVPFQESGQPLLSSWSKNQTVVVGRPPPRIPQGVLESMRVSDFVGFAPATGATVRNQVSTEDLSHLPLTYNQLAGLEAVLSGVPMMMTPKGMAVVGGNVPRPFGDQNDERENLQPRPQNARARPPRKYRRLRLNLGRLGLDEYDFSQHNRTRFAGLENTTISSYINSVLQALFFVPQFKVFMMNHLCSTENCVSCELGNLFRMMDIARGRNCHTANLVRVLHHLTKESGKFSDLFGGLVPTEESDQISGGEGEGGSSSHTQQQQYAATFKLPTRATREVDPSRLESFHSFILEHLAKERSGYSPFVGESTAEEGEGDEPIIPYDNQTNIIDQLFGFSLGILEQCSFCGKCSEKRKRMMYLVLEYPVSSAPVSFASLLQRMFSKTDQHQHLWCPFCDMLRDMTRSTYLVEFPAVLCILANVKDDSAKINFWSRSQGSSSSSDSDNKDDPSHASSSTSSSWLPHRLLIQQTSDHRHVSVQEFSDRGVGSDQGGSVYQLTHSIFRVVDSHASAFSEQVVGHFVSHMLVPPPPSSGDSPMRENYQHQTSWYMFNDVEISGIPKTEVSRLDESWVRPSILYYTDMKSLEKFPTPASKFPISDKLFNHLQKRQGTPLPLPLPLPSKLAIDSEFVYTLTDDVNSAMIGMNQNYHTLARLSIVLEEGFPDDVFMDDYVHVKEPVVDYLTQYSGIREGELSPETSSHKLSTFKQTYLKLAYLIHKGYTFVGHGLKKDFRTINVVVPMKQVIDTVEICHLSRQRKISLRFLAAVLLGKNIQQETHCSVEDARTALLCYLKCLELKRTGQFSDALHQLYHLGHKLQWDIGKATTIDKLLEQLNKERNSSKKDSEEGKRKSGEGEESEEIDPRVEETG